MKRRMDGAGYTEPKKASNTNKGGKKPATSKKSGTPSLQKY